AAVPAVLDPILPGCRREGGGEAPVPEVTDETHDIGESVAGDFGTDAIGNIQEGGHVLGREAVITAALEDDAVTRPAAQGIDLVADAALARLADAGVAPGGQQRADLDGMPGHGVRSWPSSWAACRCILTACSWETGDRAPGAAPNLPRRPAKM